MKPITSLYSMVQQCQVYSLFVFDVVYCDVKEKQRNIICEISIIIMICQKLWSVAPIQQKNMLPLPYSVSTLLQYIITYLSLLSNVNNNNCKII